MIIDYYWMTVMCLLKEYNCKKALICLTFYIWRWPSNIHIIWCVIIRIFLTLDVLFCDYMHVKWWIINWVPLKKQTDKNNQPRAFIYCCLCWKGWRQWKNVLNGTSKNCHPVLCMLKVMRVVQTKLSVFCSTLAWKHHTVPPNSLIA